MKSLTFVMLFVLFIAGCREAEVVGPPELKLGRDQCAHCGMIISDERFAAAMIVKTDRGNRALVFDDIGDMVAYPRDHPEQTIIHRYVKDFDSSEWVKADQANFVRVLDMHTPMGSGLIAYASQDAAAAKQGSHLRFEQLATFENHPSTAPAE